MGDNYRNTGLIKPTFSRDGIPGISAPPEVIITQEEKMAMAKADTKRYLDARVSCGSQKELVQAIHLRWLEIPVPDVECIVQEVFMEFESRNKKQK